MSTADSLSFVASVLALAIAVLISAVFVLRRLPLPLWQALVIAVVPVWLSALPVSSAGALQALSCSAPALVFVGLSRVLFRPSLGKLIEYWVCAFLLYLSTHLALSVTLRWTFVFPFWRTGL